MTDTNEPMTVEQILDRYFVANQNGQFEDEQGNVCWYLDDLVKNVDKATTQINALIAQKQREDYTASAVTKELENLPLSNSTPEDLDRANAHLDSRNRQYWDAYNRGYISFSDQVKKRIATLSKPKEESNE